MNLVFVQRGGVWVIAQSALMTAAIALGVVFHGDWTNTAVIVPGVALFLAGGAVGIAGVWAQGPNRSPFPRPGEHSKCSALFIGIGVLHFGCRRQFLAISEDHDAAARRGLSVRWWDFLFYVLFGFAVTSFVHIGGVLLTFSHLIVPAVCANYLAQTLRGRLLIGWAVAMVASLASLGVTPLWGLPVGATIVCMLGLLLAITAALAHSIPAPHTPPAITGTVPISREPMNP